MVTKLNSHILEVAKNPDGRLELFASRNGDNLVINNWQTPEGWSGWHSIIPKQISSNFRVAQNEGGHLEIFAEYDYGIKHSWQLEAGGWSKWTVISPPGIRNSTFCVGKNQDGRLEIFAPARAKGEETVSLDNVLFHSWQTPQGSDGWSNYVQLVGVLTSRQDFIDIAAIQNEDGRLEVFWINELNEIYHIWQTKINNGWSQVDKLGEIGARAKKLVVGRNQNGCLEVFIIGMDNKIYQIRQVVPNGGWAGWLMLENYESQARELAIAQNQDGSLEVFHISLDNLNIWRTRQVEPNSKNWSAWKRLGDEGTKGTSLAVIQNKFSELELFFVGTNSVVYQFRQSPINSEWPIDYSEIP
jgi:hypothetical protein